MNNYLKNILIPLFLLISLIGLSQESENKNADSGTVNGRATKTGLIGGLNFTSNTNPDIKITTAYYFGAVRDIQLAPLFKFQTGLCYIRNGGSLKNDPYKLRLNYLQIPTLFKVKIGRFYGLTGLTTSYRVAAVYTDGEEEYKADKKRFKRFDFGFQLGGGFKLLFFNVEARYNWGLSNIVKEGTDEINNRYLQLGVNVMLF